MRFKLQSLKMHTRFLQASLLPYYLTIHRDGKLVIWPLCTEQSSSCIHNVFPRSTQGWWVWVSVWVHICGSQRAVISIFLTCSPPYFLKRGLSLVLSLTDWLDKLTSNSMPTPLALGFWQHAIVPTFLWVCGVQNQILLGFDQLSSPKPQFCFLWDTIWAMLELNYSHVGEYIYFDRKIESKAGVLLYPRCWCCVKRGQLWSTVGNAGNSWGAEATLITK